jgi:hypothetical protein
MTWMSTINASTIYVVRPLVIDSTLASDRKPRTAG